MTTASVLIGEVAEVFNGKTPAKTDKRTSGHPVLKIKDVGPNGCFSGTFDNYVDSTFASKYPAKWIKKSDTLILNAAHNASHVASKVYLAENQVARSLAVGEWTIIRPNPARIEPGFIYWWLSSAVGGTLLRRAVTGLHLYPRDVAAMPVPLPPLDEQRRIVALLNRVAKIGRLRVETVKRLREFVPALFVRMFGDPVENPMCWDAAELRELGSLDRGRSRHRPRNAPELYGGPYPFVQTGDIANSAGVVRTATQSYSELGLSQSKLWPAGTLCITIAANIGDTGILDFDACFPDSIVGFMPATSSVTVEFVQCSLDLMKTRIAESAPMAAQRNINLRILRALPLPVPPVELQQRFSKVVQQARTTGVFASVASQHVSLLTDSLMHRFL